MRKFPFRLIGNLYHSKFIFHYKYFYNFFEKSISNISSTDKLFYYKLDIKHFANLNNSYEL